MDGISGRRKGFPQGHVQHTSSNFTASRLSQIDHSYPSLSVFGDPSAVAVLSSIGTPMLLRILMKRYEQTQAKVQSESEYLGPH